jgi:hypothetical protein
MMQAFTEANEIAGEILVHEGVLQIVARLGKEAAHDASIGRAGEVQWSKLTAGDAEHVFDSIQEGGTACASGIHEGAINVEQEKPGHGRSFWG